MNVVIIVLIIFALFVTGYILIKNAFPASEIQEESIKYSFPISKDAPKPKADQAPVYDLPSATLPEPELETLPPEEPPTEDATIETENPPAESGTQ